MVHHHHQDDNDDGDDGDDDGDDDDDDSFHDWQPNDDDRCELAKWNRVWMR